MSSFQNIYEFDAYVNGTKLSNNDRQHIKAYLQYISQRKSGNFTPGVEANARIALEHDTRLELYHLAVAGLALLRNETPTIGFNESNDCMFSESSGR